MPEGRLNCCPRIAHCGIVWARLDTQIWIGFHPPNPSDRNIDIRIDETSSSDDVTDFDHYLTECGLWSSPGIIGDSVNFCAAHNQPHFLKCRVDYTGQVYGHIDGEDAEGVSSLHDFAYLHEQELRFELPSPNSYMLHERATNIAGTVFDWRIDPETGTVTQTGSSYADALINYPNIGEAYNDATGPAASPGGSSRLQVVTSTDDNGDITSIEMTLTVAIPADYYHAGSPAHGRTLKKTLSQQFTRADFDAVCKFMLDHVNLANPAKVYDDDNSVTGWPSESIGPEYNRRLTWGAQYNTVWSCTLDLWPNRVLVVCAATGSDPLPPSDFYKLAAETNSTVNSLTLLRSRFGVAEGDTGCILSIPYTTPEYLVSGSIIDVPRPCFGLETGGDPQTRQCGGPVYGPGNYYFSNTPGILAGQSWIARRFQGQAYGLCITPPVCIDVLETWDGTNPSPAASFDPCCWPDPP